ncbi:MAG: putative Extracellular solute-binding protein family 5 [Candidatus Saccharibacteria bacterium]|nr:putative Extracellular solute-binding protein family 5 [Candidatus Saccharibacteria bacterium]
MIDRTTKLRWRRNFRRKQKQLEGIGSQTEESLDRHFFRRIGRLYEVRMFIISWLLLIVLLIGMTVVQTRALGSYYQTVKPLPGGIYSEGIVGSFTNANPIFATSVVDSSVSKLVFSGLMTYNNKNQLVGDVAKSLTVDPTGKIYTAVLNSGITWQDGKPLTAEDVVFTYQTLQNPDVKSPYFSAWQGIKVAEIDKNTVTFTLPNILASFNYSLTGGILPKHILANIEPGSLRSALFNTTKPIGSGPFKWHNVDVTGSEVTDRTQRVSLLPSSTYYNGEPKLGEFVIRTFHDEGVMLESFKKGELTAMAGVQDLPDDQMKDLGISQYNIPITGEVMAFLNNKDPILADVHVRQALVSAANPQEILASLSYPSIAAKSPFLHGMLGYDPAAVQRPYDVTEANKQLDAAGWAKGVDGIRTKDGKKLTLELNTLNDIEYATVANQLQKQWKQVGVVLNVSSLDQTELQTAIEGRTYGVLLYGISLGLDPDQFAYWHSSQADILAKRRLNFSDYSSKVADAALEAGRTRLDPSLRAAKYKPFLEAWSQDAPALALYQPHFLYVSHAQVFNFNERALNTPSDRYADVQKWMIRTERVTN